MAALNRHSDFNKLWAGQTVSNVGDRISLLALPTIAIVVLGGGAWEVGVLGALRFAPFILLAPFVGIVVDRFSRRHIMIAADVGRLVALGSIPLAIVTGELGMAHLFVVAAAVGVLTTFFEIAYQSYLPSLIGNENLVEGNTKLQVSRSLADVVGAAAGGVFITVFGAARAVAIDALTFLASLAALLMMKDRDKRDLSARTTTAKQDFVAGLRTLTRHPVLRSLLVSNSVVNLGAAMGDALLLLFAYRVLGLSPFQVGIAAACGAAAVIVGAVFSEKVVAVLTLGRTLVITAAALGAGYALLPLAGDLGAFAGLIAIQVAIGFVSPMFDIHVLTLVQNVTPKEQIGRVSGTALALVFGSLALGYALGGVLGEGIGVSAALVVAGVITAVGGLTLLAGPVRYIREQPVPESDKTEPEAESVVVCKAG